MCVANLRIDAWVQFRSDLLSKFFTVFCFFSSRKSKRFSSAFEERKKKLITWWISVFFSRTLSRSSVWMIFSFLLSLKTCKTSEVMIIRGASSNIQHTSLGWPTNCACDTTSWVCKWIFNCRTCATNYKIHARLLHIASFFLVIIAIRVFFLFVSRRKSFEIWPRGDFERQRRLALKIHYDNINTESISMAPAHSILFWVDGISAEGIKKFKNLRLKAVTWIFFCFERLMNFAGYRYLAEIAGHWTEV